MKHFSGDCPAWEQVEQAMREGKLAPIEAIEMVLLKELRQTQSTAVLLDGFPRSLEQMAMFERSVSFHPTGHVQFAY